jgi:hypothetical protein
MTPRSADYPTHDARRTGRRGPWRHGLATLVRTVPATTACIRIRSRRADIGIAEAADPVNGPGVCVATRGDFRSHQRGPQLAMP